MFFPLILIYGKEKKNYFYNNLAIHGVIIYFTVCLYITKKKKKKKKKFLQEKYMWVKYLLKCSAFGCVPIEVVSMSFWCLY